MEIVWLIVGVAAIWFVDSLLARLPDLGQLFVPSPGILMVLGLGLVTWLMHDDLSP